MMFRAITIAALVGFVSANTSYSIGCMSTLVSIGQNPEVGACLKPSLLLPILVGAGNSAESVIGYVDAWLGSMCGSPACSDDTLSALVANVTKGCSAEFGLPEEKTTLDLVKKNYRTARKVACLKDGQVNCVTGTLRNVEAVTGGAMTLQEDNILAIVKAGKKGFPSSVICTNCMKGAYTIINKALPGSFSASDTKYATDMCGASFADGGIPPGLVESAREPAATSTTPAPTTAPTTTTTTTPTTVATPVYRNAALGGPSLSSAGAFMAVAGLITVAAGMV